MSGVVSMTAAYRPRSCLTEQGRAILKLFTRSRRGSRQCDRSCLLFSGSGLLFWGWRGSVLDCGTD